MRSLMPNKQPRDLSDRTQWLNSSGETVPAYGVIRLFSYDDATNQFQADKPDGSSGIYYPNGGVSTISNGFSASPLWNLPRRCLVDSLSYNVGDTVGPVAGQWGMGSAGSGFKILRPPNADKVAVVQMEGLGGGGGGSLFLSIVSESHGRGYYTLELAEWVGSTPDCAGGATLDNPECDICTVLSASGGSSGGASSGGPSGGAIGCGDDIQLPVFDRQLVGIGVYVLAYDPASTIVPLELLTDCYVMDLGSVNSTLSSGSTSSGGPSSGNEEPVWHIVRGHQTHTLQYREESECCGGVVTVTRRQAIIFAALVCEEETCNNCEAPV